MAAEETGAPEAAEATEAAEVAETPEESKKAVLVQFVARVKTAADKEQYYRSNFTMDEHIKVEDEYVQSKVEGAGDGTGTVTVEFKEESYDFAYVNSSELGYWTALRTDGTLEETVAMMAMIDAEHQEALPSFDERGSLDFMSYWATILQKYADAAEVEVHDEDAKTLPASADDSGAAEATE